MATDKECGLPRLQNEIERRYQAQVREENTLRKFACGTSAITGIVLGVHMWYNLFHTVGIVAYMFAATSWVGTTLDAAVAVSFVLCYHYTYRYADAKDVTHVMRILRRLSKIE